MIDVNKYEVGMTIFASCCTMSPAYVLTYKVLEVKRKFVTVQECRSGLKYGFDKELPQLFVTEHEAMAHNLEQLNNWIADYEKHKRNVEVILDELRTSTNVTTADD
jgi:cell division FtsZ-interacting protein ZapD